MKKAFSHRIAVINDSNHIVVQHPSTHRIAVKDHSRGFQPTEPNAPRYSVSRRDTGTASPTCNRSSPPRYSCVAMRHVWENGNRPRGLKPTAMFHHGYAMKNAPHPSLRRPLVGQGVNGLSRFDPPIAKPSRRLRLQTMIQWDCCPCCIHLLHPSE